MNERLWEGIKYSSGTTLVVLSDNKKELASIQDYIKKKCQIKSSGYKIVSMKSNGNLDYFTEISMAHVSGNISVLKFILDSDSNYKGKKIR
jgi:hypothetical protein